MKWKKLKTAREKIDASLGLVFSSISFQALFTKYTIMKPSLLLLLILLISCRPPEKEKIPLASLEFIDLAAFEANFTYPDTIDTISAQLHKACLNNNSASHMSDLDVNILFNDIESGSEGPYKYFKTSWTDNGKWLILAIVPANFSYLLMLSDKGELHDAIPLTHYLPGPANCDFDRREIISFDPKGEIVLEEIYGVALINTDSCERVENTDRYKINELNYFELIDRKTTSVRVKKYSSSDSR